MRLGATWQCGPGTWLLKSFMVTSVRRNRLRRVAMIFFTVLSLAVSVATRYCLVGRRDTRVTTIVTSHSLDAHRQHLLNDGVHWSAPASAFVLFEPIRGFFLVRPAVPPRIRLYSEDYLYNRPPPAC